MKNLFHKLCFIIIAPIILCVALFMDLSMSFMDFLHEKQPFWKKFISNYKEFVKSYWDCFLFPPKDKD